jgi:hypothetical protein
MIEESSGESVVPLSPISLPNDLKSLMASKLGPTFFFSKRKWSYSSTMKKVFSRKSLDSFLYRNVLRNYSSQKQIEF